MLLNLRDLSKVILLTTNNHEALNLTDLLLCEQIFTLWKKILNQSDSGLDYQHLYLRSST
jgi:hypothetical protein